VFMKNNNHSFNKILLAAIAASSITLTACGSGKTSMFRGDISHTAVYSESGPTRLDKLVWKYSAPDKTYSSPVVANGTIYLGSNDKHLYAIDQNTGQMKWSFKTGGNIESTPAISNGIVYVGSWDKTLYAINEETRALVWKQKTEGPISASPIIADGIIYFASEDSNLYAADVNTGARKWSFNAGSPIYSSPAIYGEYIFLRSIFIPASKAGIRKHQGLYCHHRLFMTAGFLSAVKMVISMPMMLKTAHVNGNTVPKVMCSHRSLLHQTPSMQAAPMGIYML